LRIGGPEIDEPQTASVTNGPGLRKNPRKLAHRKGFEPLTPRFVVWCSIQLSYRCGGARKLVSGGQRRKRCCHRGRRESGDPGRQAERCYFTKPSSFIASCTCGRDLTRAK